ncbi:hypothetical protein ACJQWK_07697 [Exserohilum turcicum]
MDTPRTEYEGSPRTPGIYNSRTEYASIPTRSSDEFIRDRSNRLSRFDEDMGPGLRIQMDPMASPDVTSRGQDSGKNGYSMFAPAGPTGLQPLGAKVPDTPYLFRPGASRTWTDSRTERLIAHRATQSAQWRIHWQSPALMVFAFIMGIVLAFFQHILYTSLHHRQEADENKKFRLVLYGRLLAYLAKVAFGGCAILVFRQRLWRTFRERAFTVFSIDQLFGATEDPSLFANREAITNAPILVAIAVVFWLIPLATIIFSPGALTFGTYRHQETVHFKVPTINFSKESYKDWRHSVPMAGGGTKKSMIYSNTTDKQAKNPGWFDYYDQPSAELVRVAYLLAYSNMYHPNVRLNARRNACRGAYNCTYTQSFIAPSYRCEEISETNRLRELGAPFNLSKIAPLGPAAYYAEVGAGDYKQPQLSEFQKGTGGIPLGEAPESLGVFKSEPVLWIGYAVNSTERLSPDDPLAARWTFRYDAHILRCVHMVANYTTKWNFTEPMFNSTTTREHLYPIINTTLTRGIYGMTNSTLDPTPAENYISPRGDVALYKKTAAYHAMGEMFRRFLSGHVDVEPPIPGPFYTQVYSHVTKTRMTQTNGEPKKELKSEIEGFYSDMVLSLLSAPEMLVVDEEETKVERSQLQSSFVYVPLRLLMCYVPVVLVTVVILIFGLVTIWQDGTTFSTGFSRILVTTRNTTLDHISRGACLGNDPFPMELMHTKLQFGVLADGSDPEHTRDHYQGHGFQNVAHCAFGVASEIGPIVRGAHYAGLRRRETRHSDESDLMVKT